MTLIALDEINTIALDGSIWINHTNDFYHSMSTTDDNGKVWTIFIIQSRSEYEIYFGTDDTTLATFEYALLGTPEYAFKNQDEVIAKYHEIVNNPRMEMVRQLL